LTRINNFVTIFAFAVVAYFVIMAINAFTNGVDGAIFDMSGFFNSKTFQWSLIAQGAATACFSFLGFDALTAMAEDVDKPEKTMPKAIILTCVIMAVIFIMVSWISQCLYPDFNAYTDGSSAIMDALAVAGGSTLCNLVSISIVISMFAITVDMTAASTRMVFAMGREGALPKRPFGYENHKNHVPVWNVIILSGIFTCFIWVDVNVIVSMVTFGGLLAYILVNFSAVRYFFFKKKERKGILFITRFIFPVIGLLTSIFLWLNLGKDAKILGFSWTALGIIYMAIRSKGFKEQVALEADNMEKEFER
jgi:putrescine importer